METTAMQPQPGGNVTQNPSDTTSPPPTSATEPILVDSVRVWSRQEPADESQHYYGETYYSWPTDWSAIEDADDFGLDNLDFDKYDYIILTYYCRCSGVILEKATVSDRTLSYDLKIYQDENSSFREFSIMIEIPKPVSLSSPDGSIFRSYTGDRYDYDRHPSPVPFENT